jgi:exopolyphosphatase/pppGpp-phosphohydrolase
VTFEARTSEELVEQALRLALETLQASRHTTLPAGAAVLRDVVERVRGQQARHFLRAVTERSRGGQTLTLVEVAAHDSRTADPSASSAPSTGPCSDRVAAG